LRFHVAPNFKSPAGGAYRPAKPGIWSACPKKQCFNVCTNPDASNFVLLYPETTNVAAVELATANTTTIQANTNSSEWGRRAVCESNIV